MLSSLTTIENIEKIINEFEKYGASSTVREIFPDLADKRAILIRSARKEVDAIKRPLIREKVQKEIWRILVNGGNDVDQMGKELLELFDMYRVNVEVKEPKDG